ncbi:hypothetical protein NA57DRAFT_25387, partial [Rhizodiscina lignyota]
TLTLAHPTPAENLRQQRNNGAAWKGSLNLEQYLRREAFLVAQDHTRDGGLTSWILIDTSLPLITNEDGETERIVLSGCETIRKRALLRSHGTAGVRDVICHGVGSVFCPVEFRRRGYAGRMMQLLGDALRSHQNEKAEVACTTLYSDIGKTFYALNGGWQPFESAHVELPAVTKSGEADNGTNGANGAADYSVRPLYQEDLPSLCEEDERLLRATLEKAPSSQKTTFALIPDKETINWMHSRENFVCGELYQRSPEVKGAIVGSEQGKRAWCYWVRMNYNEEIGKVEENVLYILRLVVEPAIDGTPEGEKAVAALLKEAQKEAGKWNMEVVSAWNPSEQTVRAASSVTGKDIKDVKIVDRESESITSLRWYGEMGKGQKPKDVVEWIANEKFAWC